MWVCRALAAVRGGSSPQSSSTSVSPDATEPLWSPEQREDGARFRARDFDGRTVLPDLERSQNPQFHEWNLVTSVIVGAAIQHVVKVE